MRKSGISRFALIAALLIQATACSTIKSWFPDKEKDYQFTTEIPELIIPEDLKTKTMSTKSLAVASMPAEASASKPSEPPVAQAVAAATVAAAEPVSREAPAPQAAASGSVSTLQVDQSGAQAWWLVGKALSRQKVEVIERNLDKGYFYVKYDPYGFTPEDGSVLDELSFFFGDDPRDELEYRITVQEIGAQLSEVTVQNSEGKSLSSVAATSLLKLITDGINLDLPKTPSESDKPASP